MIMHPSNKGNSLLFIHTTGPTHAHRRDNKTKTNIRRHVMSRISQGRRKAPTNPSFDVSYPYQNDTALLSSSTPHPTRPFWPQDPLTILDQQWKWDMFSPYGLVLMAHEGIKSTVSTSTSVSSSSSPSSLSSPSPSSSSPTNTFWFPFAFTSSIRLAQFRDLFASPTALAGLYTASSQTPRGLGSAPRATVMALERSTDLVGCIQRAIADPRAEVAARDGVIRAVVAVVCYNLITNDLRHLLVHMEGLSRLVLFRGGLDRLAGGGNSDELRLMIFWADVTSCLLLNTGPRFPIPWDLIPALPTDQNLAFFRPPLGLIQTSASDDTRKAHIAACIPDLDAVSSCLETELALRGENLWKDEVYVGLRVNPIIHRLFSDAAGGFIQEPSAAAIDVPAWQALRLGAILWLIWVKRKTRSYPCADKDDGMYVSRLLGLLHNSWDNGFILGDDDDAHDVRLWLLALCGISCGVGGGGEIERTQRRITELMIAELISVGHDADDTWLAVVMRRVQQRGLPWISAFDAPLMGFLAGGLGSHADMCMEPGQ